MQLDKLTFKTMPRPIMIWGNFIFFVGINSYNSISKSASWEWTEYKLIDGQPALVPGNRENDTLDIEGVIYPKAAGIASLALLEVVKSEADAMVPKLLMDIAGNVFGKFVLLSLRENRTYFSVAGIAQKIEFSMSFKRYPESTMEIGKNWLNKQKKLFTR